MATRPPAFAVVVTGLVLMLSACLNSIDPQRRVDAADRPAFVSTSGQFGQAEAPGAIVGLPESGAPLILPGITPR